MSKSLYVSSEDKCMTDEFTLFLIGSVVFGLLGYLIMNGYFRI